MVSKDVGNVLSTVKTGQLAEAAWLTPPPLSVSVAGVYGV